MLSNNITFLKSIILLNNRLMSHLLVIAILVVCQCHSSVVLILPIFSGWGMQLYITACLIWYFALGGRGEHLDVYNQHGKYLYTNNPRKHQLLLVTSLTPLV